jgi:NADH-quinone oxidoreductase subunit C
VYEPVSLAQDFRQFDFMSPWEGADYILPGDEKAAAPAAPPPAAPPAAKPAVTKTKPAPKAKAVAAKPATKPRKPKAEG